MIQTRAPRLRWAISFLLLVGLLLLMIYTVLERPSGEESLDTSHLEVNPPIPEPTFTPPAPSITSPEVTQVAPPTVEEPPQTETFSSFMLFVHVFTREGVSVAGAQVNVSRITDEGQHHTESFDSLAEGNTDERGEALLEVDGSGRFLITASWNGLFGTRQASLFATMPKAGVDVVLKPVQKLAGKVVDTAGRPVAHAAITCMAEKPMDYMKVMTATTDAEGEFELAPLPRDVYYLRANAEGFAPCVTGALEPDAGPLVLVMTQGGALEAEIRDESTGQPVAGVQVSLRPRETRIYAFEGASDSRGLAVVKAVVPGDFDLWAWSDDYAGTPVKHAVEIWEGQTTRIEVRVVATAVVEGSVTDSATGQGIADVEVRASLKDDYVVSRKARTDADGVYALPGLPAGTYTIGLGERPAHYGYRYGSVTHTEFFSLEPGERLTGVDFELSKGKSLHGQVVYDDGSPVPGAEVKAWSPDRGDPKATQWPDDAIADGEGRFRIDGLPDGFPVYLRARFRALQSQDLGPLTSASDSYPEQTLVLQRTATSSISGQVVNTNGKPVQAFVQAIQTDASHSQRARLNTISDVDGFFLFPEVAVGTYQLAYGPFTFSGSVDHTNTDGPFVASASQPLRGLRLVLDTGGPSISGVVYDAEGRPASHHTVRVDIMRNDDSQPYMTTRTDGEGRFVVQNVEDGVYRVRVGARRVTVRPGEEVRIDLPPANTDGVERP